MFLFVSFYLGSLRPQSFFRNEGGVGDPLVKPQNRFFVNMLRNVGGLFFLAARPPGSLDPPNPAEPRRTKPNHKKTHRGFILFFCLFSAANPAEPRRTTKKMLTTTHIFLIFAPFRPPNPAKPNRTTKTPPPTFVIFCHFSAAEPCRTKPNQTEPH